MVQIIILDQRKMDRKAARASIGNNIQVARIARRRSLASLGKEIGASAQYLSAIENGRKTPSSRVLVQLRDALNVSLDYLMSDEGASVQHACELEVTRASESQRMRRESARKAEARK